MKEIEILNKITGILENIDGHEVLDVQTRIEKLAAEHSRFSITFDTKKVEENISVPDKPKTEPDKNSEEKIPFVKVETGHICDKNWIAPAEIEPVKAKKKTSKKLCSNCVNCYEYEEIYSCQKNLKTDINKYTAATFCDEYKER